MAIQQKLKKKNTLLSLDDDLLFEVLGRLPPKSLYVCKSVCKAWFSIIAQPEFVTFYRNQLEKSTRLLLSIRDGKDLFSNKRYLLGTNLLNMEECLSVPYTTYYGVTQVINSLICFYIACRVRLCNLTTSEIMDLPLSHYRGGCVQKCRYFFGFDPISATYKLLKIDHRLCEILTLGENMCEDSWKSLGDQLCFPHESVPEEAFCVNGVLYWLLGNKNRELVSFDLNRLRFRSWFLPDCLNSSYTIGGALQFRGCLAFAYICGTHFNIFSRSREYFNRTTHTFKLPTELIQECNSMIPIGSLPTGEIMLVYANHFTTIYSYDPENQKFERFGVPDQWKSKIYSASISSFEANLSPLSLILKQN